MSRTACDWGRGYVPGTQATPSECELYRSMCSDWGRGYEPGAAPQAVGVVPAAPAPGPHVARVGRRCRLRLAGRDTSWSHLNVTQAVGVYQARPLSVVDVTARQWRPAGSEGPIRVSRGFTYLGALFRGSSNGLYLNYSVRVQLILTLLVKLTSIGPIS